MFVVGRFLYPSPDDQKFDRSIDAERAAEAMAKRDEREMIAVWDDNSTLQSVFCRGYQLEPC